MESSMIEYSNLQLGEKFLIKTEIGSEEPGHNKWILIENILEGNFPFIFSQVNL